MTTDRRRIEALFEAALEQPKDEREAWLSGVCDDAGTRAEVQALLAAHERSDGLFERVQDARIFVDGESTGPVPGGPADDELSELDARVGPYRLIRELGRGGMGIVYLAERADGVFWQRVAVKLVQRGLRDPGLRARFEAERQILAALEHPNIARLLDGGLTPDGRPYLVMEYVDGVPLDRFCERGRLPLEERIRLFCTAARAVQHAHRHLVVHRDLKPSNILVTDRGTVKLVDFGVAKILDPARLRLDVSDTRTGQRFLTPEYASPEQVTGQAVTTVSDVYALGVVLYELLCDVRPYRLGGRSAAEAERLLLETRPEPPSRLAESSQDASTRRRARRLRGDLDRITLMALRKEPERRYPSAEALADDLERHLAGKPVRAVRDSARYRARKFVRRHRAGVAAAAAVGLSLAGGLGAALWQADRAGRARDRAEAALAETRDVNRFLVGLFGAEESETEGVDTTAALALLGRGRQRLDELSSRPAVEGRLLEAMGMMYRELGDRARADSLVRRSLAVRRATFGERHEETAAAHAALALVTRGMGRYEESVREFETAWRILQETLGPEHPRTTEALYQLGGAYVYVGRREDAERAHREVLEIRRRTLPPDDPGIADALEAVAAAARRAGRFEATIRHLEEALEIRRRAFGPDDPEIPRTLILIGDIYFIHMHRDAEAEPFFREAIEVHRRRGTPPGWKLAHALGSYAYYLSHTGDRVGPDSLYPRIIAMLTSTYGAEHPRTLGEINFYGDHLFRTGRLDRARDVLLGSLEARLRKVPPDHPWLAGTYLALARVSLALGDLDATEAYARGGHAAWLSGREGPNVGSSHADALLARVLVARGDFAEARRLLDSAERTVMEDHGRPHPDLIPIYESYAALHAALGDTVEAARYREMATALDPRS